jgi:autotransporter-associated beta strand protein
VLGSGTYAGSINSNVLGTGAGQTLVYNSSAYQSLTGTFTSTAGNEGLLVNAGTVSLDGNMTAYNGNMRANGGTIRLGSAGALGTTTGTVTIGSSASSVVDLNGYSVVGKTASLTGGSLSNLAIGTTSTWSGSVFSTAGSTITTGGTVANSAASIALPNGLQGGVGNVTKEGSGVLIVTGSLGTPQMRINLGTLRLTTPGTIMSSSGTFTTNSSNQANFTPTLAFGQSGTYGFGTWLISSGNFTTDSGTAVATFAAAALGGSSTKTVQVDANTSVTVSGTTDLANGSASSRGLTVRGAGDLTFSGAVIGSTGSTNFSILKTGTAASQTGTLTLSSANSYNGTTTVEAGTLKIGNASSLGSTDAAAGTVVRASTVAGLVGTLDLNGQDVSGESLTLTGTNTNNTSGTGAFLVNNNSGTAASWAGSATVSGGLVGLGGPGAISLLGAVDGVGSIVKVGSGTATLGGSNTFNNLTVSAGVLRLTGAQASGSGSLAVNSDATLNLLASLSKDVANSGTIAIGPSGSLTAASIGSGAISLSGVSGTTANFTSTAATTLAPASVTMSGYSTITLASATSGLLATGSVSISGLSNVLSVGGVTTAGSTYSLISGPVLTNTGSITLTGAAIGNQTLAVGGATTVGRTTYSFNQTATALQLAVTGTTYDLFWNGGPSSTWDYTTASWQKDGVGTNVTFVDGDRATLGTAATITVDSGTSAAVRPASLTVNNAVGTVALSGSGIETTGTFGKSGAGDLTMSNAATFGSGAWISGGSVTAGGSVGITTGGLNVSGGAFTSNSTTTVTAGGLNVSDGLATLNNPSSINGGIAVTGGTAAFNAANTVSGAVTASNGGTISLGNMSGVGSGGINLDNGRLISTLASGTLTNTVAIGAGVGTVSSSSPFTIAGSVTGTSRLTVAGSGDVVLSGSLSTSSTGMAIDVLAGASARLTGANKFFFNTSDIGGTLTLDNATITMRNSAVIGGAGTISLVGTGTIAAASGSGTTSTINATISGSGGLVFTNGASSRTVILGGNNTYSGGTQLVSDVGATSGSAFGTGLITAGGGKITNATAGSLTLANNLALSGTVLPLSGAAIQITGTVTGSGILRASSGGTIDISQQTAATMLSSGTIDMGNNGVVKAANAANFGSLTAITASGTGNGSTLQALANTGSITQVVKIGASGNNPSNFNVDTNGFHVSLAGVIQNLNSGTTGGLVKSGVGSLTLSAANTYTGATHVSAGRLLVNGSLDSSSAVTVAAGAALGGSGTIGGNISFLSGADFVFDPLNFLTVSGSVTFGGFGITDLIGLDTTTADGTYTLMSGGIFSLANVSNLGSANAYDLGSGKAAYLQTGSGPSSFQVVVVPEPSALGLAACGGLLGLVIARQRSARRNR